MKKIRKVFSNSFVRRWMLAFIAFITVLFACFLFYTYLATQKQLQQEVTAYSEQQAERIAMQADDAWQSFQRIAHSLTVDNMVNIFLFGEDAETVFPNLYTQIYQQLNAYCQSSSAIDSIYVYSAVSNRVFISDSKTPATLGSSVRGSDFDFASADSYSEPTIVPRKKGNIYPYLLTLFYPVRRLEQQGLIAVNIDVAKLSFLKSSPNFSSLNTYLISDSGELLCRSGQHEMPESLSDFPQLSLFRTDQAAFSQYVKGNTPYVYVQQHAENLPWYYVTVYEAQGYTGSSFNFFQSFLTLVPWLALFVVVIVILLSMLITHPFRTISDFLENPMAGVPKNISEPETAKIIRQVINYIQTNQKLSDELTKQMERQNKATFLALQSQINPHFLFNTLNLIRNIEIDALGYDHEAPRLTLELSKLLRYAIDSTDLVPLDTELYYTGLYLDILNERYEKQLVFSISDVPSAGKVLVPKLIIQPLIENAVFHGCFGQPDATNRIDVDVQVGESRASITVRDNGAGIAPERLQELRALLNDVSTLPRTSIGLQNVAQRMYLTFGAAYSFDIESTLGQGTSITLTFPVLSVNTDL